jgi:hypothetical protein
MESIGFLPNHFYTRLHARTTQEAGAFTVSVRDYSITARKGEEPRRYA